MGNGKWNMEWGTGIEEQELGCGTGIWNDKWIGSGKWNDKWKKQWTGSGARINVTWINSYSGQLGVNHA